MYTSNSFVYRATVTYSNTSTGQIIVRIPSLTGTDSVIELSKIGRAAHIGSWSVPNIGDQIIVTSDDANFTNTFWVQTDAVFGPTGPTGPAGTNGTNGTNGDWSTAQTVASITTGNLTSTSVGKLLYNTAACTLTVTSSTGFEVGQRVDLARLNAGSFTVAQGSGATLSGTPALTLRAQYSAASIICTASNTYLLIGDLG